MLDGRVASSEYKYSARSIVVVVDQEEVKCCATNCPISFGSATMTESEIITE